MMLVRSLVARGQHRDAPAYPLRGGDVAGLDDDVSRNTVNAAFFAGAWDENGRRIKRSSLLSHSGRSTT